MSTRAVDPEFEKVFRSTFAQVVRFVARRVTNAADAADVVSSTYLEALVHWRRYDARRGEPLTWVLGIARNLCAREGRRRRLESRALARVAGRRLLDHDEFEELEAIIDAVRLAPALAAALERLDDLDRELFRMTHEDELSTAQAASVLGMSGAAARMRLMRARRRLGAAVISGGPAADAVAEGRRP